MGLAFPERAVASSVAGAAQRKSRVFLVDDLKSQRELVKHFLSGSEFEVVGEADSAEQALELVPQLRPDLVLLDVNYAPSQSLNVVAPLLRACPDTAIVVFSDYEHDLLAPHVSRLGAVAYLEKQLTSPLLPTALSGVIETLRRSVENRQPTILLVDDDEETLESLAEYFPARLGVRVRKASNATLALEILSSEKVDLIVSDHNMPNVTGLDLLTQARRIAPHVPRVMLTAYGDEDLQNRARTDAGVEGFLSRSLSLPQIESALRDILARRRRPPELRAQPRP